MNELMKPNSEALDASTHGKTIKAFNNFLASKPTKSEVKVNELAAGNPRYVPVDIIEGKLDELFNNLWQMRVTDVRVVVNEIVYTVELTVFHPIAQVWLTRAGTGAAQIRMRNVDDKQKSSPIDVHMKIKNTLEADAPHALANALKNAAKRFGETFGRSLNREDSYTRYFDDSVPTDLVGDYQEAILKLSECETADDVKMVYESYPILKTLSAFRDQVIKKGNELKTK
mgnify:CR=1 FL=1